MDIIQDKLEQIYAQAEAEKSFKRLVPFKSLLFRWQHRHPADIPRIAAIGSHRLGNHLFCTLDGTRHSAFSQEKCDTIAAFIAECDRERDISLEKNGKIV